KFTNKIEQFIVSFNYILHKISSVLLVLMMLLITADVVTRYFFNSAITGAYELTELILALIVFYSLGTTQLKGNNIEIDFFTRKMPQKFQHGLRSITSFVLFLLISLTTWQLFVYTKRVWLFGETKGDLELPLYIFIGSATIGMVAFAFVLLLNSIKLLAMVVKK